MIETKVTNGTGTGYKQTKHDTSPPQRSEPIYATCTFSNELMCDDFCMIYYSYYSKAWSFQGQYVVVVPMPQAVLVKCKWMCRNDQKWVQESLPQLAPKQEAWDFKMKLWDALWSLNLPHCCTQWKFIFGYVGLSGLNMERLMTSMDTAQYSLRARFCSFKSQYVPMHLESNRAPVKTGTLTCPSSASPRLSVNLYGGLHWPISAGTGGPLPQRPFDLMSGNVVAACWCSKSTT